MKRTGQLRNRPGKRISTLYKNCKERNVRAGSSLERVCVWVRACARARALNCTR